MAVVRIGTSGYSYDDWVGPFYPADLEKRDFLAYYSRVFDTVEVNYTYYTMPSARTLEAMAAKVGEDFSFAVKAHKSLTHERTAGEGECRAFAAGLEPLVDTGRLGAVLLQFPWSFKPSREAVQWLDFLASQLKGLPLVVEFRHAGWVMDRTFEFLDSRGLGFCCVDQPQMKGLLPPVAKVTGGLGYVRFHGRNAAKWWQHEEAWERYNYLYSREELGEWVPKIAQMNDKARVVYAFFNNHYQAQAVQNAMMFRELLEDADLV